MLASPSSIDLSSRALRYLSEQLRLGETRSGRVDGGFPSAGGLCLCLPTCGAGTHTANSPGEGEGEGEVVGVVEGAGSPPAGTLDSASAPALRPLPVTDPVGTGAGAELRAGPPLA